MWPEGDSGNLYKFQGAGFTSILDFRVIYETIEYRNDDQAFIFTDIVQKATTGANGTVNWTIDAPTTGRVRDATVKATDLKTALKYLTDWCDNIDGFDFRAFTEPDFERVIQLRYPRDSRALHTIISRPGIEVTGWEDDWTWVANNLHLTGEEDLQYSLFGNPRTNWPRMDHVEKADSVSEMPTLIEKAQRYASLHDVPLVAAELTVFDGPSGVDWIGDDVRLIDTDAHDRDAVFQLVQIDGEWAGSVPVEKWTLVQTLRQEEQMGPPTPRRFDAVAAWTNGFGSASASIQTRKGNGPWRNPDPNDPNHPGHPI